MRDYLGLLKFYLPLTYPNIIWQKLNKKAKTILDVGCGNGSLMVFLNKDKRFAVTGIDAYQPYLKKAEKTGVYQKLVLGDIRKLSFRQNSFDIVFCSQVIEHLKKKEGERLIDDLEKIAKKQMIISTTVGFFPFEPFGENDENPLQTHKSGWQPEEFEKRGYKIYGQGAGFVYGSKRMTKFLPKFFYPLAFGLSYFLSPVFYLYPNLAAYMICVKDL